VRGGRVGEDSLRSKRTPDEGQAAGNELAMRALRRDLEQARAQVAAIVDIAHEALDGWESLAPIANDESEMARIAELRAQLPPPRELEPEAAEVG
jgi:hypothetical protein